MKTKEWALIFLLIPAMVFLATACGNDSEGLSYISPIDKDREGNSIKLPPEIERIISMGPSNTEIIVDLGFGDKIIAVDTYSDNIPGIDPDIPMFSMMGPDGEQIISLNPDVIFVTGMSKADGGDLLKGVSNAGACIIYMPSSTSINAIQEDIRYISRVLGAEEKGEAIISEMEGEINGIKEIGETITAKKRVYFEIEAPPYLCSFGRGVFLNEMIEIIGAENICGDQESWVRITDETVVYANPDVILTSVNYIEDPVAEIRARTSWSEVAAVKNGEVYYIDTDSSNRPSHKIVIALREMAEAIYPEMYK